MFKFLKEKLGKAVSIFSKKVEEEAEIKKEEKEVEKEVFEEKPEHIPEKKQEPKPEQIRQEKPKIILEKKKVKPDELAITYFVHGTTPDNEDGMLSGHSQIGLSVLGKKQSLELRDQVKYDFDAIFTSDLKRAVDSADITWPDKKKIQDKRLREVDYGDLTSKPEEEFNEFKAEQDPIRKRFPNGECFKDVEKRIRSFLNDVYKKHKGEHIAIVAHRYTQLAIEVLLNGKTWEQAVADDWRLRKAWQPGWNYMMREELEAAKEEEPEREHKGFFAKLFHKKHEEEEKEKQPEEESKEQAKEEPEEETVKEEQKTEQEEEKEQTEELKDEVLEEEKEEKDEIEKKTELQQELIIEEEEKGYGKVLDKLSEEEQEVKPWKKHEEIKEEKVQEEKTEEKIEEEKEKPEKKGFFARLKETLTTVKLSEEKFEKLFWDLELAMLENNVAVEVIEKIKDDLKKVLTTGKVSRKDISELIHDSLKESVEELFVKNDFDLIEEIKSKKEKPYIIAFIGVNGSGKTTTMAKLAHLLMKKNLSVVFAASDTFRAAAIQQLQEHADKLGVKMIRHEYESDPAAVAFDAVKHASAKGIDVVMIDTAGRLHSNDNLMNELKKLVRVNKPDLKIFVGESITGNDCVEQAKLFNEAVGIDAIILAKADVDEKGGAAISVSYVTGKPIIYLGTGQTYDDLSEFKPEIVIESIGL